MENQSNNSENNKLLIPASIVVAGVVVAAAVLYSGTAPGGDSPQDAEVGRNAPAPAPGDPKILEVKENDHVLGNPSAPVTFIEYGDFECPFCGRLFKDVLGELKEEYVKTGKVKFIYRHFPLNSIHPEAQGSAEASECAAEQGKFWEMHDIMFERQPQLSYDNYKSWAGELGLDMAQFSSCLDSGKYTEKILAAFDEGAAAGVTGTPGSFINGKLVPGAQPYSVFKGIIDEELDS